MVGLFMPNSTSNKNQEHIGYIDHNWELFQVVGPNQRRGKGNECHEHQEKRVNQNQSSVGALDEMKRKVMSTPGHSQHKKTKHVATKFWQQLNQFSVQFHLLRVFCYQRATEPEHQQGHYDGEYTVGQRLNALWGKETANLISLK